MRPVCKYQNQFLYINQTKHILVEATCRSFYSNDLLSVVQGGGDSGVQGLCHTIVQGVGAAVLSNYN